jgi:hypothetical protein
VSTGDLLGLIIGVVLGIIGLSFLLPEVRYRLRLVRSQNWPVVHGVVQKGEILHAGATRFVHLPFRSLLGYRYQVNGDTHWGLFVLPAEDMQAAENLQKQADGKSLVIKYDPNRPDVSFVACKELLGRRVIQSPMWLDPS